MLGPPSARGKIVTMVKITASATASLHASASVATTVTSGAENSARLNSHVTCPATAGGVMLPLSNMEGAENAETAEATWGMLVSSDTSDGRSMRGVACRSRGRLPTFGPPKASENVTRPTSIGV